MSILSVAWHRLTRGDDSLTVFRDTKTQVDAWIVKIEGKVPAEARPMLEALVADVKQGASNLAGTVEDILPTLLVAPTAAVDDAFSAVATAYLGPSLGGALSKVEVDGLNKIEAWFINQIKSAKLTHIAAVTGASAQLVAPAPPQPGS